MALTDFTDYATVRALLGVAEEELEDATLALPIYGLRLDDALEELNPQLAQDYLDVKAEPTPTKLQAKFIALTETFSAYQVASVLLGSIAMFAPKTIKDDKSEQTRVNDPYKDLRADVAASLGYLTDKLLDVYAQINPDAPVPVPVSVINVVVSPLAVDPVTGV